MPLSTPWRRPETADEHRPSSPRRPAADCVEPLSPRPHIHSIYSRSSHRNPVPTGEQEKLRGLGLSRSERTAYIERPQPDHLYFDEDGAARIGAKFKTNKGVHSNAHDLAAWASADTRKRDSRLARSKGHTRSGSTIDDLATAAIATSPHLINGSPTSLMFNGSPVAYNASRPATSYVNSYREGDSLDERAPKRIRSDFYQVRSEKLHSMEWSPREDGRQRTISNHFNEVSATSLEEVELLLGLRHASDFKKVSPPQHRVEPFTPLADIHSAADIHTASPDHQPSPTHRLSGLHETLETVEASNRKDDILPTVGKNGQDEQAVSVDGTEIQDGDPEERTSLLLDAALQSLEPLYGAQSGAQDERASAEHTVVLAEKTKKPRRIKTEVQAEACAACQQMQRDIGDEQTIQWIECSGCRRWFHASCAGFRDKQESRSVDKFVCKECEPIHGQTTFVRKSTRARTAIDYAGLNQGVVKPSAESTMHHYVPQIKDGRISYLADDFARVRPELLTADFFEKADGIPRPFVVPAAWNPRFGAPLVDEIPDEPLPTANGESGSLPFDGAASSFATTRHTAFETLKEPVLDCDQDLLDMVMPRHLTVRKVSELYGPAEPVPVIDVKSQQVKGSFTLADWADYYENTTEKPIRNVISLEVSQSLLGKLLRRPRVVRDLDLEDSVWDADSRKATSKRSVQFYCLMSVADSFTDFHIDFGGSSVYYHILKGTKTFFFIPPEDKFLKRYEEWCNSEEQNVTWLGDLCGGNCTRVDLHEGDTAFIPAGWIHSVWTPEDSLVIGGNFLTHLDYAMQIKVANVEKVTQVPMKFRYPFFQKVMWFTLIKYLEDDPVPTDVLGDFLDDAGYMYLRANPVWHDFGRLSSDAEPGTAEYNSKYYSKAEIAGLPALRDYLYRTARVAADLPVPDITKKQIDAVKASVPKTHGDPLKLIKEFAIWCSWKIGNVAAPDWVHADELGEPLTAEKREKSKKNEPFRVPPERTSLRKASQSLTNGTSENTSPPPIMAASGTAEAEGDMPKKKSPPKGGAQRMACEACRKRRIKCRHKDEGDSANATEPVLRPKSTDIPNQTTAVSTTQVLDSSEYPSLLQEDELPTFNPAQSVLDIIDEQVLDVNTLAAINNSAKKGRSKACEECRKSKRRCVHDENGRIDPVKANEPSKPRGSTGKRRSDSYPPQSKRLKYEDDVSGVDGDTSFESLIDPALIADVDGVEPQEDGVDRPSIHELPDDRNLAQHSVQDGGIHNGVPNITMNGLCGSTFALDPALAAQAAGDDGEIAIKQEVSPNLAKMTTEHNSSIESNFAIPQAPVAFNDEPFTDMADVLVGSRFSSRPQKQVDRYNPSEHQSPSKPTSESRRGSSATSGQTIVTSTKSRRSSSNTSGNTHQIGVTAVKLEASGRPVSRGSTTASSEIDADERLARELAAAEHGLRRRTSMWL